MIINFVVVLYMGLQIRGGYVNKKPDQFIKDLCHVGMSVLRLGFCIGALVVISNYINKEGELEKKMITNNLQPFAQTQFPLEELCKSSASHTPIMADPSLLRDLNGMIGIFGFLFVLEIISCSFGSEIGSISHLVKPKSEVSSTERGHQGQGQASATDTPAPASKNIYLQKFRHGLRNMDKNIDVSELEKPQVLSLLFHLLHIIFSTAMIGFFAHLKLDYKQTVNTESIIKTKLIDGFVCGPVLEKNKLIVNSLSDTNSQNTTLLQQYNDAQQQVTAAQAAQQLAAQQLAAQQQAAALAAAAARPTTPTPSPTPYPASSVFVPTTTPSAVPKSLMTTPTPSPVRHGIR